MTSSLPETGFGPIQERRKIRKGTFSCWECKTRKIRCEVSASSRTICSSCQRRRLPCISQEFPNPTDNNYGEVEQRIGHVEALVNQLLRQKDRLAPNTSRNSYGNINGELPAGQFIDLLDSTTISITEIDPRVIQQPSSSLPAPNKEGQRECHSLSIYLQSILPPSNVIGMILSRNQFCGEPFPIVTSSTTLAQVDDRSPPSTVHPVHFARKLIQLALCIQRLDPSTPEMQALRLNLPVPRVARHYIDVASRCVTSQDLLVDSLDGLETLTLEARYHLQVGNLRGAWLTFRRALGIAQLLGIARRHRTAKDRAESLWFRLVYSDRFLSLMLGLPFTVTDSSFANENQPAADRWLDRLERIHVVVVGRIITRNLRMQHCHRPHREVTQISPYDDYKETQDIDHELKKASGAPPADWWVPPMLDDRATYVGMSEKFSRLLTQMHQFYLLLVLHQPYFIKQILLEPEPRQQSLVRQSNDFAYSKHAVLLASREVLTRFRMFRGTFDKIPSQGLIDKAFIGAISLLLAHVDGHRLGQGNVLEHQRPQDLAIISRVTKDMEDASCTSKDSMSRSRMQVLRKLMEIEVDAAQGATYFIWLEERLCGTDTVTTTVKEQRMSFLLPYLGILHISCQKSPKSPIASENPSVHNLTLSPGADSGEIQSSDPWITNNEGTLTFNLANNGDIFSADSQITQPSPELLPWSPINLSTPESPLRLEQFVSDTAFLDTSTGG